ncbi:MAG: sodium:calcium antiporter [Clostridiales bacterium]|nr:sodium:calcium antiporter [Clostridiales bacterium]
MGLLFLEYIVLAVLVVYFSLKLSFYVDELDKKTALSGAFIGGIMLAAVTSLPELFTSITAVCIVNEPNLVLGNVLGSDIFNLVIIGICLTFAAGLYTKSKVSKTHLYTLLLTVLMYGACYFGITHQNSTLNLLVFSIDAASVAILIIYIINVKLIASDEGEENEESASSDLTPPQIMVRFVIFAVLLVITSIVLTMVTDKLADSLELGKTVAGAIFLGVATSLPELTSSINLVRLKNFNASIGNVTGSNIFNFIILVFGDLLYTGGSIYYDEAASKTILMFGVISTFLAIGVMFSKKSAVLSRILGLLLIVSYVSSIVLSM